MHLLPIEFYLLLVIIIPLAVCFIKWRYSLKWSIATLLCAGLSWLYFNLWMMKISPPNNGFANFVYIVSGWFWLLPVFAIFWCIFRFSESKVSTSKQYQIGVWGCRISTVVASLILFWNFFGRMSEERAINEAKKQLESRDYEIIGRVEPHYIDGHWIIRYPDSKFREIRLNRNGSMSWIGGPG